MATALSMLTNFSTPFWEFRDADKSIEDVVKDCSFLLPFGSFKDREEKKEEEQEVERFLLPFGSFGAVMVRGVVKAIMT